MFFGKNDRFSAVLMADRNEVPEVWTQSGPAWLIPKLYLAENRCFRLLIGCRRSKVPYFCSVWNNGRLLMSDPHVVPWIANPPFDPTKDLVRTYWPWSLDGHQPMTSGTIEIGIYRGGHRMTLEVVPYITESDYLLDCFNVEILEIDSVLPELQQFSREIPANN